MQSSDRARQDMPGWHVVAGGACRGTARTEDAAGPRILLTGVVCVAAFVPPQSLQRRPRTGPATTLPCRAGKRRMTTPRSSPRGATWACHSKVNPSFCQSSTQCLSCFTSEWPRACSIESCVHSETLYCPLQTFRDSPAASTSGTTLSSPPRAESGLASLAGETHHRLLPTPRPRSNPE